jgi:hypothetical protein
MIILIKYMINLNYDDFLAKCWCRQWRRIPFSILVRKYDEYNNLKAKLYRLLSTLLQMEINISPNVINMALIVAFFDNVSSYFRSKRITRTL